MSKYFKQILLGMFLVIGLAACASYIVPTSQIPEVFTDASASMMFQDPSTTWKYVDSFHNNSARISVFLPKNQTETAWNRKISIRYFKEKPPYNINAYEYYLETALAHFNVQCYGSTSDVHILEQSLQEVMYMYQMYGCGKNPNQFVLGRIIEGKHSISSISYAIKARKLSTPQKQAIYNIIKNAKVIRD